MPTTSEFAPPAVPDSGAMWAKDVDPPQTASSLQMMPVVDKLPEYVLRFDWLSLSALTARIYIGHIDGLDGAPPDMTKLSDAEIIAGFPQWSSVMTVREHYRAPG